MVVAREEGKLEEQQPPFPRIIEFEKLDIRLFESTLIDLVARLGNKSQGSDFFSSLLGFCRSSEDCRFYQAPAVGALFVRSRKSESILVRTDAEGDLLRDLITLLRHPRIHKSTPILCDFSQSLGISLEPEAPPQRLDSPQTSPETCSEQASSSASECPLDSEPIFTARGDDAFHQSRSSLVTDEPEEAIGGASHRIVKAFLDGDKAFIINEDF